VLVSVYEGIAARHFQAARARPVAEGEEASRHQKKDEEAAAALKIQAAVRGANARRDLWEEREEAAQDVMRRFPPWKRLPQIGRLPNKQPPRRQLDRKQGRSKPSRNICASTW